MNKLDCKPPMLKPKCKKVGALTIVVLPAQYGTSDEGEPFAPQIGDYTDSIVKYLADNKIYAYDKDGNWTFISDTDATEPTIDHDLDIHSTNAVQNHAIATAINGLTAALETEAAARATADTTLQGNIDTEAATRISADQTIEGEISALAASTTADIQAEATARQSADTTLQNNINSLESTLTTAITNEATTRSTADTAIQGDISTINSAIDKTVMTDLAVNPTTSTTVVQLDTSKQNIKTSATVTGSIPLPVASATQAGVMNSSTYNAVASNTSNINALMNGAVAVTGLPANPTQAQITTAWQNQTGLTTLINRASVYDVTNEKVWTYYTNDTTWHVASNTTQVTVDQFTNASAGIIKGSTNDGQVYAESDGTGSVNGWDALTSQVSTNTSKLSTIAAGAEVNVQSDWNQTTTTADDYIKNKPTIPTVNNGTLTIQKNGSTVQTFTANQSGNATANITVPTKTSDITNDSGFLTSSSAIFDDIAYINGDATTTVGPAIGTSNITDGAVTAAKLADGATSQITMTTTDPGEGANLSANHFIAVYEA